ncbi:apolipoprotein N-acyltransferase [Campylobacter sp. FMV-PI01]|uniref:Apolipoprotein N-acyltransferase n=1 Tax=Campylobacter portucalensis TaxID=2608384 RepID=A0A6L5WJX3_9BACT|nr:apolipoprotein N-acyltransferase [Campylobacter portucalensis]MSN96051.1 apolipoprotein N-acyltransferase [Campylobacter portucalensis]
MSQKYCYYPYTSFTKKIISRYSTINEIIKCFFIAILISNFIFLSIFDNLWLNFISPFLTIFGFLKLFKFNKIKFFYTGFFIGILWFYWVSFSLRFYDLSYLIPIEILFFGLIYGLIFLVCGWFKNLYFRAFMLLSVSYFYPFNFNWLNLEATLVIGIFEPNLRGLGFIFAFIIAYYSLNKFKFISIFLLIFALQFKQNVPNLLPLKIYLANTNINQEIKWKNEYRNDQIKQVLNLINKAIMDGYEFIILPENAIVSYVNLELNLMQYLKEKSHNIGILTGGLAYENDFIYNSAFLFKDGDMKRFDKFILVPFGEEIPLPTFIKNFVNKIFFKGASDIKSAKNLSTYEINGFKITNAICYEVTRPEIYANNPDFVIAISNNGWFMPSTEPNLQRLLIKYYATKHATTIYHSVNGSKSEIITPKKMWIKEFIMQIKSKS